MSLPWQSCPGPDEDFEEIIVCWPRGAAAAYPPSIGQQKEGAITSESLQSNRLLNKTEMKGSFQNIVLEADLSGLVAKMQQKLGKHRGKAELSVRKRKHIMRSSCADLKEFLKRWKK